MVAQWRMPALFTSTSRCPWSSRIRSTTARHWSGTVTSCSRKRAADRGRGLLALLDEHVGDVDGRALLGEQATFGRALSACPAGDQRYSMLQHAHDGLRISGSSRIVGSRPMPPPTARRRSTTSSIGADVRFAGGALVPCSGQSVAVAVDVRSSTHGLVLPSALASERSVPGSGHTRLAQHREYANTWQRPRAP